VLFLVAVWHLMTHARAHIRSLSDLHSLSPTYSLSLLHKPSPLEILMTRARVGPAWPACRWILLHIVMSVRSYA